MTTDTEDDFLDVLGDIYVETATSLLYEAKFFKDFVLTRPASPAFHMGLSKLSHAEFAEQFEEFYGDHRQVHEAIRGMVPDIVVD